MNPSRSIGILQPCYMPWLGYFEQISLVDNFILLDTVQYTKADWRNRNRIKTSNGLNWLTVPVKRSALKTRICDVFIDYSRDWVRKHLASIKQSYGKSPYFEDVYDRVSTELQRKPELLLELNLNLIKAFCHFLEIDTPIQLASQINTFDESYLEDSQNPNERLLRICKHFSANLFYEGASGANYLDVREFEKQGIRVVFQKYQHPSYRQLYGDFESHISVIDLIMNEGPRSASIMRGPTVPTGLG